LGVSDEGELVVCEFSFPAGFPASGTGDGHGVLLLFVFLFWGFVVFAC
jgi:hypothetical protein